MPPDPDAAKPGPVAVVIPMAGRGQRFAEAGYEKPKPFIDVGGAPMIAQVMANLDIAGARYLLVAQGDHLAAEPATVRALEARGDVAFIPLDGPTEGAACTVLQAAHRLDPEAPLLIANCDQLIDFDSAAFLADCRARGLDGSILVFRDPARGRRWSFAAIDAQGRVTDAREKEPISDLATVGVYYFARARTFLDAAAAMIAKDDRANGEFYVAPVYRHAIRQGAAIGVYEIACEAMHDMGTPQGLEALVASGRFG